MYLRQFTETFIRKMKKLRKKDRLRHGRVMDKIDEIMVQPQEYKHLGNVMAGISRVHIDPHVLTYEVDEKNKAVIFLDFDHHDRIYKN